jgi:hypothetical protein
MSNWYYVLVPPLPNAFLGRGIHSSALCFCQAFLSLTDTLLMLLLLKSQGIQDNQLCMNRPFAGREMSGIRKNRQNWTISLALE